VYADTYVEYLFSGFNVCPIQNFAEINLRISETKRDLSIIRSIHPLGTKNNITLITGSIIVNNWNVLWGTETFCNHSIRCSHGDNCFRMTDVVSTESIHSHSLLCNSQSIAMHPYKFNTVEKMHKRVQKWTCSLQ
jgi:hypothetical protein